MEHFIKNDIERHYINIQEKLSEKIDVNNKIEMSDINTISGIDIAYWNNNNHDYAVCCIVTINFKTKEILEIKHEVDKISVPYIAGYLSFRELPLIIKTYSLLETKPDLAIFDGNGILHYRNMGIATHASFYLNIPTIGVAKSYLKINGINFIMPEDESGKFTDIIINDKICGRALRTHKGVKPIFVSSGNWVNIDTATHIVLELIAKDSRQPLPIRLADIETKKQRKLLCLG